MPPTNTFFTALFSALTLVVGAVVVGVVAYDIYSVEVPYGRADYVSAVMERSSGTVEICLKRQRVKKNFETVFTCKTVEKSSEPGALVMWKAPR